MNNVRTSSEEGFTLIEVLCAFAILSLASVVILQTMQLAAKSVAAARERATIRRVASEVLLEKSLASVGPEGVIEGVRWKVSDTFVNHRAGTAKLERFQLFHPEGSRSSDYLVLRRQAQ
ncbi:type II secretion system protein [Agrobacterium tumefaciens]|uniref:type II secretion system protein n=1 Tax=Agrobacterium tumefaciens TaxID=358 RepID=UPI0012300245|nr:type II secretion system protein [Agrobacterium tumefaciens]